MKLIVATPAPKPQTKNTPKIALLFAATILLMVTAQLFSFEELPAALQSSGLVQNSLASEIVAMLLVSIEVFALPFLLRMPLSPAFRAVSIVCGWLVALAWFKLTLLEVLIGRSSDSLLLGTTIPLPVGWWNVFLGFGLMVLAVWTTWGMSGWKRFNAK